MYNYSSNYNLYIMNDFWNNISRYPRFFISSVIGLVLIIIAPFKNLFKIPKLRIILIVSIILFLGLLYIIIRNMSGL
jgi:hypothetical protein